MSDTVKKFSKRKGFESIPRELLQSKELSLEAIGLLCNMQSYPDNWVLHKTELRKRFVNKEKVVDRIWDELVSTGYILQFWKRDGRRYVYEYFFNVEKFTVEEIQELCNEMNDIGMTLYHKAMIKIKKGEPIDYKSYLVLSDEEKDVLDLSFWDSQIGNLKKERQINDSSDSHFGNPNLEMPKREDNKLTIKRLTIKTIEEEEDVKSESVESNREINKGEVSNESDIVLKEILNYVSKSEDYRNLTLVLRGAEVSPQSILTILSYFDLNQGVFDKDLIKQQLDWMSDKANTGSGIGDFGAYFVNGYEKRLESKNVSSIDDLDMLLGIDPSEKIKMTMHNWLEGE